MHRPDISFTRATWQHLLAQIRAFLLATGAGALARALLFGIFGLQLAINGLNVVNSYVGRDVMTAIASRQELRFMTEAGIWVLVFAASTLASVLCRYSEDRLGLHWREWTTRQLIERYMARRNYLRVAAHAGSENADQRIAEDVKSFTTMTLSFALMIFNASITVIAFSAVLWMISPALFTIGVAYAAVGSGLSLLLGRPLISLNYRQLDCEADFRGTLIQVKENAQLVALTGREATFSRHLLRHLGQLVGNGGKVIEVQRNLGFFTTGYNWLLQLIPLLIVAPLFMRGEVEFGVITQSAMAFTHLLGAFSLIVTQTQVLSSLAAVVARLEDLDKALEDEPAGRDRIELHEDDTCLAFEHLTLLSAHRRRVLIEDLDFSLLPGQRLLIQCVENDARAALLLTIAGLRRWGHGHLRRPGPRQMMYLPEQPYVPDSTVLDLLGDADGKPDTGRPDRTRILEVLTALGLESVLARCIDVDVEQHWPAHLSNSELLLLMCARVLLARPRFVVLERPDMTLERATLAKLLALFTTHGITYIVLGTANDLPDTFDQILALSAGGRWALRKLDTPPMPPLPVP